MDPRAARSHSQRRRPRLRAPRIGPRGLAPGRAARVTLRLAVPDDILTLVRFGTDHPEAVRSGFWHYVEGHMLALVNACLPAGAREIDVSLDARRTQVVLSFRPGEVDEQ